MKMKFEKKENKETDKKISELCTIEDIYAETSTEPPA